MASGQVSASLSIQQDWPLGIIVKDMMAEEEAGAWDGQTGERLNWKMSKEALLQGFWWWGVQKAFWNIKCFRFYMKSFTMLLVLFDRKSLLSEFKHACVT